MEWLLWSVPEDMTVTFRANEGSRLIVLDLDLKKGENAELSLQKIFDKEHFTEPLRISMLSSLHSLLLMEIQESMSETRAGND